MLIVKIPFTIHYKSVTNSNLDKDEGIASIAKRKGIKRKNLQDMLEKTAEKNFELKTE